jgi:hypothetical protein
MDTNFLRRWATPLTIGTFLLISITGILMFFEVRIGLIKVAHEWLSLLMVAAVGLHVTLHWRLFSRYFTQKPALAVIGLFGVILVASLLIQGGDERRGPPGGRASMQAVQLLTSAPLDKVAGITGNTLEGLQTRLQTQGLKLDETATSLADIARQNQRTPAEVLNSLISPK